ncbi:MAG: hypothetical protein L3K03_08260 [Thermoplasmata archaeon]|nr:hypothetical protein [Thermoplasmata archaeon]
MSPRRHSWSGAFVQFLKAHPILCLAILTPGIPEYLSTSSPWIALFANPIGFFLSLAINVGQYTAGALLIREAMLRWGKGWGSVFLLGAAYAITEEGLGDNTLFNTTHNTDGALGIYGHFVGVSWVWANGVVLFHVIYSIGLPILLLGLALPETRGRSLLGSRGILACLGSLTLATLVETLLVWSTDHFWMGTALLLGSFAAIAVLVLLAYRVPADWWRPRDERSTLSSRQCLGLGLLLFPSTFILEYGFTATAVPAGAIILACLALTGIFLEILRRGIGRRENEYLLVNLAFGFLIWQAAFGLLLTILLPYTIPLILITIYFCLQLRRAYSPRSTSPGLAPTISAG